LSGDLIFLKLTDPLDNVISIEQCGYKTRSIQWLLFDVMETLKPALQDVRNGTESSFGFPAMFKDDAAIVPVLVILQHMYTMSQILGLRPAPSVILRPRFACVDLDSVKKYEYLNLGFDPWERCHKPPFTGKIEHVFYVSGTAYIFLCSSFFILKPKPTVEHCPTVGANKFVGSQMDFYDGYQAYNMIYALASFYLGKNALDANSDPREVFDWNDWVSQLNVLESVINPTNMELYVACESVPGRAYELFSYLDCALTLGYF